VETVDAMYDLYGYISKKKMRHVIKSLETYVYKHPCTKDIQIDVVFVK